MDRSGERSAVLVLRLWEEPGRAGLRGRLTSTLDLERREESTLTVSSAAEALEAVRSWLEAFEAGPPPRGGS